MKAVTQSRAINNLRIITKQDEYETPTQLFEKLCKEHNVKPKLDACGSYQLHKLPRWFGLDSLKKDWKYDFWLNPPYSKVNEFVRKAYYEHIKHNVTGMILVYAKTDTKWFHDCVYGKAELYFLKGRIKFWRHGKQTKNSSPYPSMVIIYRAK